MDINKLGDELLQLTINQLPALDQVAVSRVSKKFKDFALKSTSVLDVYGIPRKHRLEVVQKMPKLVSIVGLYYQAEPAEVSFFESVPGINMNIEQIRAAHAANLSQVYIESAKKKDANYTGSRLGTPFHYEWYKEMTSKYPDLDIKCFLFMDPNKEYHGDKKCDLAITSLVIVFLNSSQINETVRLLNRTINVANLYISFEPDCEEFTLFPFLDAIARLPLKELSVEVRGVWNPKSIWSGW